MLTGLLFAIEEAVGDPARLVATLPFAGTTLIEHQADQLIAAGAGQIIVIAERQSPELVGALHRIGRRGVALDVARGAVEASATLHPLARVAMVADGLVTTDAIARLLAQEGEEALLVVPADGAPTTLERIGGASAWAGGARLVAQRLADLAQLPPDYDPQSTLVRIAEAAGATRLPLPPAALRDGHGIERDAALIEARGHRIMAAAIATRSGWFDRFVVAPLSHAAIPLLVARRVDITAIVVATAILAGIAAAAMVTDWIRCGVLLVMLALLVASFGRAMTGLRDEHGLRPRLPATILSMAAGADLLLGWRCSVDNGTGTAVVIAVMLVMATILIERAGAASSIWAADAAACMTVVTIATLVGYPVLGLALATCYAGVTLTAAIEALKRSSTGF